LATWGALEATPARLTMAICGLQDRSRFPFFSLFRCFSWRTDGGFQTVAYPIAPCRSFDGFVHEDPLLSLTSIAIMRFKQASKKAMDWLESSMCSERLNSLFSRLSRRKRSYVLIILQLAYANALDLSCSSLEPAGDMPLYPNRRAKRQNPPSTEATWFDIHTP
jgi:hypothetical protein